MEEVVQSKNIFRGVGLLVQGCTEFCTNLVFAVVITLASYSKVPVSRPSCTGTKTLKQLTASMTMGFLETSAWLKLLKWLQVEQNTMHSGLAFIHPCISLLCTLLLR